MGICGWLSESGDFTGSTNNEIDRVTAEDVARDMVSISKGYLFDEYLRYTSRVSMSVNASEFLIQHGYVRIDTSRENVVFSKDHLTIEQEEFVDRFDELNVC